MAEKERAGGMDAEELKRLETAAVVDCQGEPCPGPVLKAMEALNDLESGEVMVLQTDIEVATENVKVACETGGLASSLGVVEEDGIFRLYLKKT